MSEAFAVQTRDEGAKAVLTRRRSDRVDVSGPMVAGPEHGAVVFNENVGGVAPKKVTYSAVRSP